MPASAVGTPAHIFALLALVLAAAAGAGLYHSMDGGTDSRIPLESYYRAVYLLQRLGGPAAEEAEAVPGRVPYLDETESLAHHPDTIQVLQRAAEELAAAEGLRPKAPLFEAYARLALGERERAAQLLTRYVAVNSYEARHYALLCETLYSLSDYSSLLLICREWAERDAACREERAYYLWAALHNRGRYADAARSAAEGRACLGWRAEVYGAKSLFEAGDAGQAEKLVSELQVRFPEEARQIARLWELLRDKSAV